MSKKAVWIIIGLMGAAMFGIAAIQLLYLNWQFKLDDQKFDVKVYEALGEVKNKLEDDAETVTLEILKNKKGKLFGKEGSDAIKKYLKKPNEGWSAGLRNYELSSIPYLLDPESKLKDINLEKLDSYIKQAFDSRGLLLDYDYGVYSMKDADFTSLNGNFVATVGVGASSDAETDYDQILYNTPYSIQLFDTPELEVGALKINFPSKRSFILSSIVLPLIFSLLFTGLIAFCFIYTMIVVFRQKKVSEMKTDFINNMTHEFKTPIATISLASDSILSPTIISNEDKIKRFTGIIKQENTRMLNQVEKVLQMARIDKKEFDLNLVEVNIHETIMSAVENSRLKVELKDGTIETNLTAGIAEIQGDQNHLSNIIHNLLDNAEKYSSEKPQITVTTRNVGKAIEISVEDNGIGMTKESVKHIFDKFYRVHTGNRHDVKGFGLGLSYVKALVDAHNGEVKVKSELGKGSTFILKIPLRQSDQA